MTVLPIESAKVIAPAGGVVPVKGMEMVTAVAAALYVPVPVAESLLEVAILPMLTLPEPVLPL